MHGVQIILISFTIYVGLLVLGCHIEMSNTQGVEYPTGSKCGTSVLFVSFVYLYCLYLFIVLMCVVHVARIGIQLSYTCIGTIFQPDEPLYQLGWRDVQDLADCTAALLDRGSTFSGRLVGNRFIVQGRGIPATQSASDPAPVRIPSKL